MASGKSLRLGPHLTSLGSSTGADTPSVRRGAGPARALSSSSRSARCFRRDRVVAMRPDGAASFRFTDFDRILGELGEYGCTPNVYLYSMTTH